MSNMTSTYFKRKLLLYSIAASASVAAGMANAGEVALKYEKFDIKSPEAMTYWEDSVDYAKKLGVLEPHVLVAKHKVGDREIVVSMLSAMNMCGLNECPVRIFVNDEMVLDMNDCTNTDFHSLNETGSLFFACDSITPIPSVKGRGN